MIAALILAAGQSTRFGESKQLVALRGKPLLQHAIDCVNASRAADVILVLGASADEIQKQIEAGRARVVVNPKYAEGMSTSIIAGLQAVNANTDAAMIVLADQPLLMRRTLDRIIEEYEQKHPSAVIPTYEGVRGNPVLVDRGLFPEMMRLTGDIGCRAIFGDHAGSIVTLAVDDPGIVTDVDTMDDLQRLGPPPADRS